MLTHSRDEAVGRKWRRVCDYEIDSTHAGCHHVGEHRFDIGEIPCNHQARGEQPFLSCATNSGHDNLAAIALDLFIGQRHGGMC